MSPGAFDAILQAFFPEEWARRQAEKEAAAAAQRAAEEAARRQAEEVARKQAEEAAARAAAEQAAAQAAAQQAAQQAAAQRAAEQAAAQRAADEAARQAALQQQTEAAKVPFAPINAPEPAQTPIFQPQTAPAPAPAPALPPIAPTIPRPTFTPIVQNPIAQELFPYQPFEPVPVNFFTSMLGGGAPNFPQNAQPQNFFQNMVANPVAATDPFAPQVFSNPVVNYTGPVAFQPAAPVTPIGTNIFALRPLGGLV